MKCVLTVKDEVWCYLSGLTPSHIESLHNTFGVHVDGYFFMPAYKMGRWDGKIRFFEKTGKTYLRLIDRILPYLDKWGYDVDIVDQRKAISNWLPRSKRPIKVPLYASNETTHSPADMARTASPAPRNLDASLPQTRMVSAMDRLGARQLGAA